MAAQNLKVFYIGLAAVAVIGAGAILYARGGSGGSATRTAAPPTAADSAFPGYVLGSETAPVEVEEFADFECPACQRFAALQMPDVRDRLINTGRVRWRFRDFPLSGHPKTMFGHEGAACAGEQGKFWEMHDQLYFNQTKWVAARNSARAVRDLAKTAGVDLGKYDECVDSHRYEGRIVSSAQQGARRGVNSTPSFIINNTIYPGVLTYDSLKAIVDNVSSGKLKTS